MLCLREGSIKRWVVALCGLALCLAWGSLAHCHAQAGTGSRLLLPSALAYDANGNLYIADKQRNQVVEATLGGTLVVVAGTGVQGFAGDGGPAAGAELNMPQGLAFGPDGTLYIADTGNARVRSVSGGVISTFAGSGAVGDAGDGSSASAATLRGPTALAVDGSGALLICDPGDQRVRRVADGVIDAFAGSGLQGFGGDGAAAVNAALDSPSGIAVAADGRVFVADTHNNLIRLVGVDGSISTFAGTGVRASAGDGGTALQAAFSRPQGLALDQAGSLWISEGDGERVRSISANGIVSTQAGSGTEGASSDGATARQMPLRAPRGVAVSPVGQVIIADSLNGAVRVVAPSGQVFQPAALVSGRTSSVAVTGAATQTYGQASTVVKVTGVAGTPLGAVTVAESGVSLGTVPLVQGSATLAMPLLPAGRHLMTASFPGDGVNPQASARGVALEVTPLAVTATAQASTMAFGAALPQVVGSLEGVLPQDSGQVAVVFRLAEAPAATGEYTVVPVLTGARASNYTVMLAPSSGQLHVVQAATATTLATVSQGYTGIALQLAAEVVASTSGKPTGTVRFLDGTTVVATGTVVNGSASASYVAEGTGTRQITAVYSGDGNYGASTSGTQLAVVSAMPDFTIAAVSNSATVSAGAAASYSLTISGAPGPFTGVVTLSATGLPAGASMIFSPVQVVPGSGSAVVTATVQTSAPQTALRSLAGGTHFLVWACGGGCLICACIPGRRRRRFLAMSLGAAMALCGCGARSVGEGVAGVTSQAYPLQITGTSTDLAGAVVSHAVSVSLTVQQ